MEDNQFRIKNEKKHTHLSPYQRAMEKNGKRRVLKKLSVWKERSINLEHFMGLVI